MLIYRKHGFQLPALQNLVLDEQFRDPTVQFPMEESPILIRQNTGWTPDLVWTWKQKARLFPVTFIEPRSFRHWYKPLFPSAEEYVPTFAWRNHYGSFPHEFKVTGATNYWLINL